MSGKKSSGKLKSLAIVLIVGVVVVFYFLYEERSKVSPSDTGKHQIGYNDEDRQNLERLIHQEGQND